MDGIVVFDGNVDGMILLLTETFAFRFGGHYEHHRGGNKILSVVVTTIRGHCHMSVVWRSSRRREQVDGLKLIVGEGVVDLCADVGLCSTPRNGAGQLRSVTTESVVCGEDASVPFPAREDPDTVTLDDIYPGTAISDEGACWWRFGDPHRVIMD